MPRTFTCALTGHDAPFLIGAADGSCASLEDPTVEDLLEDLAELHEYHCACDTVVGSRVSVVSAPLDNGVPSPHDNLATIPLALHTRLYSLGSEQSHLLVWGEESGPNEILRRSRSKKYTSLTVDGGTVLKRSGSPPVLPSPMVPSYAELCSTQGSVFIDKSDFIRVLLHKFAVSPVNVIRRPPGFGKTTLLSMVDAFFDSSANCAHFPFIFDETMKAEPAFHPRRQLLVFSLDLAELVPLVCISGRGQDPAFEGACRAFLDAASHKFFTRYREILCAPESATSRPGFTATFNEVLYWSREQEYSWCFLIDNYTAPSSSCPDTMLNLEINCAIFSRLTNLVRYGFISYGLVVGNTTAGASGVSTPSSWADLTDDPKLAAAVGFTQAEVAALGQALSVDLAGALRSILPADQRDDERLAYAAADVLSLARRQLAGDITSVPPNVSVWTMAVARPEDDLPLQQIMRRGLEIVFGKDCFVPYDNGVRINPIINLPIPPRNNWVWDDEPAARDGDSASSLPELSFPSPNDSSDLSTPSSPTGNQGSSSRNILNDRSNVRRDNAMSPRKAGIS